MAAAKAGLTSPSAAADRQPLAQDVHFNPASRAAPAPAAPQWSFARRQAFGPAGRRSFERGAGGVATALAEQRQRRLRRRDAKPADKHRVHAEQLAVPAKPQAPELRARGLSGARLQQAAAAASAAHDAISAAVAEACQQQQHSAAQPVAGSSAVQGPTAPGATPPAAQQLPSVEPPEQPPTPPQPTEVQAHPQQPPASPAAPAAPQQVVLHAQQPTPAAHDAPAEEQGSQGAQAPPQQPAGGLSFKVSDGDDWALRERSGALATPQSSLPLCLQWMDALGSGSIPQLVPVTPTAAAAAPPPLPPSARGADGSAADAAGPPGVSEAPRLRPLRPRRRARLPSFPASPAAPASAESAEAPSPDALDFGASRGRNRLARSVSNSSTASCRRSRSSGDFSSHRSVSPFAAYSDTPFEDDDQF